MLGALFLTGYPLVSAYAEAEWIKILSDPEYEILADRRTVDIDVPVELGPTINWSDVRLRLLDVRIGSRADARWFGAFSLDQDPYDTGGRGPGFTIHADLSRATEQGLYRILIEANAPNMPPAVLALSIRRPAAKLAAGALRFENVLSSAESTAITVVIEEESGVSGVDNLTGQASAFVSTGRESRGGTLRLDRIPSTIRLGGSDTIRVSLVGAFPLGVSNGNLQLRAPQLDAPLHIPVEVHTRRTYSWLVLAIILGLVLGWVTRVHLQRRVELGRTRLPGYDILKRIDTELSRSSDPDFRVALNILRGTLQDEIIGSDSEKIKAAISSVDQGVRTAITDLESRLSVPRTEVQKLNQILNGEWFLPREMATALGEIARSLIGVEAFIAKRNAGGAAARLVEIQHTLRARIHPLLSDWKQDQTVELSRLEESTALPASVSKAIMQILPDTRSLLQTVGELPASLSADELGQVLSGIDATRTSEQALIRRVAVMIINVGVTTATYLRQIPEFDKDALEAVTRAVGDFEREVRAFAGRPEEVLKLILGFPGVQTGNTIASAIDIHLQRVTIPAADDILARVKHRDYEKAAEMLVGLITQAHVQGGSRVRLEAMDIDGRPIRGGARSREVLTATSNDDELPRGLRTTSLRADIRMDISLESPPLDVYRARAAAEIFRAGLARSVVAGLFVLLIGWLIYVPSYMGTSRELAGIFLWAFGLDISVDVVMRESSKLRAG